MPQRAEGNIEIEALIDTVYGYWETLENLPRKITVVPTHGVAMIRSSSHLKHQHASVRLSSLASITSSPQPACRRANARRYSLAPFRSSSLGGALPTSSRI